MTSKKVYYLLWHTHYDQDLLGGESLKLIGLYSDENLAKDAIEASKGLPGFIEQPENFEIAEIDLNETSWKEGYFTTD